MLHEYPLCYLTPRKRKKKEEERYRCNRSYDAIGRERKMRGVGGMFKMMRCLCIIYPFCKHLQDRKLRR